MLSVHEWSVPIPEVSRSRCRPVRLHHQSLAGDSTAKILLSQILVKYITTFGWKNEPLCTMITKKKNSLAVNTASVHSHWVKAKLFFDHCRCSMWTTNWISLEFIWKLRRFHSVWIVLKSKINYRRLLASKLTLIVDIKEKMSKFLRLSLYSLFNYSLATKHLQGVALAVQHIYINNGCHLELSEIQSTASMSV